MMSGGAIEGSDPWWQKKIEESTPDAPGAGPWHPGETMAMVGQFVLWPGLILLAASFFVGNDIDGVVNLARLQFQLMLALAGAVAVLGGIALVGFGAVVRQLAGNPGRVGTSSAMPSIPATAPATEAA